MFKFLGEAAALLNKAVSGYDSRVRKGLVDTGDDLVKVLASKSKKRDKLIKHYCRKWKADRQKLR